MLPLFESGAQPQFQAWPLYSTSPNANGNGYAVVADTFHLQPLSYNVTQKAAALNLLTCS